MFCCCVFLNSRASDDTFHLFPSIRMHRCYEIINVNLEPQKIFLDNYFRLNSSKLFSFWKLIEVIDVIITCYFFFTENFCESMKAEKAWREMSQKIQLMTTAVWLYFHVTRNANIKICNIHRNQVHTILTCTTRTRSFVWQIHFGSEWCARGAVRNAERMKRPTEKDKKEMLFQWLLPAPMSISSFHPRMTLN